MATECKFVETSLKTLANKYNQEADFSGIDDIVVSYVTGVLDDVVAGEQVDCQEVVELVSAYEPCFSEVPIVEVDKWLCETALALKNLRENSKEIRAVASIDSIVSSFTSEAKVRHHSAATSQNQMSNNKQRKYSSSSSTSSNNDVEMLLELFPDACRMDAERCLLTSAGDVQQAISLMLDCPTFSHNSRISALETAANKSNKLLDDKTVKANIMNKYGFIDQDDDRREHRPIMPKWEGKKMIRYRDNKVVSLKGERYTEVKKELPEDIKKAAPASLKPGRQTKCH